MNSRKALTFRQKPAQTTALHRLGLSCAHSAGHNLWQVSARVLEPTQTPFRNPSPWRQSGANVHVLPPFFIGGAAAFTFEREFTCPHSPKSQQRLSLQPPLPAAFRLRRLRFSPLRQAQRSAQQPVRSSAARPLMLQRAQLSAVQPAPSQPLNKTNIPSAPACVEPAPVNAAVLFRDARRFFVSPTPLRTAPTKDTSCSTRS